MATTAPIPTWTIQRDVSQTTKRRSILPFVKTHAAKSCPHLHWCENMFTSWKSEGSCSPSAVSQGSCRHIFELWKTFYSAARENINILYRGWEPFYVTICWTNLVVFSLTFFTFYFLFKHLQLQTTIFDTYTPLLYVKFTVFYFFLYFCTFASPVFYKNHFFNHILLHPRTPTTLHTTSWKQVGFYYRMPPNDCPLYLIYMHVWFASV